MQLNMPKFTEMKSLILLLVLASFCDQITPSTNDVADWLTGTAAATDSGGIFIETTGLPPLDTIAVSTQHTIAVSTQQTIAEPPLATVTVAQLVTNQTVVNPTTVAQPVTNATVVNLTTVAQPVANATVGNLTTVAQPVTNATVGNLTTASRPLADPTVFKETTTAGGPVADEPNVVILPQELFTSPPTIVAQIGDSEQNYRTSDGKIVVLEELQFRCVLSNSFPNWIYDISWYINDVQLAFHHTDLSASDLHSAVLREQHWGAVNKIGFNVKCRITARLRACAIAYAIPFSSTFFAGIRSLNYYVYVAEGETRPMHFTSTVPVACWKVDGVRQKCYVQFEAFGRMSPYVCPDRSAVEVPASFARFCGPTIVSDRWSATSSMDVRGVYSKAKYSVSGYIDIKATRHLPTGGNYRDVWEGAEKNDSYVYVYSNSYYSSGSCWSNNDPHMRTFDGSSYESHVEGVFVLYQHKQYPYSVQLLQKSCSVGRLKPTCNYGVAIQSGADIFVVIRDGDSYSSPSKVFKYGCFDSGIKVNVGSSSYSEYEVTLPSGTKISISRGLNSVRITKSESDAGQVEGLCGNADGDNCNDFNLRDAAVIRDCTSRGGYSNQPTDFITSWSVRAEENLYGGILAANGTIDHIPVRPIAATGNYCSCQLVGAPQPLVWAGLPIHDDICVPYKPTVKCDHNSEEAASLFAPCNAKRAEDTFDLEQDDLPEATFNPDTSPADPNFQGGWTEAAARPYCTNLIQTHPVYQICQSISEVDVTVSINMCVEDIKLTGDTEWANLALESYKQQCQDAVLENSDYWAQPNSTNTGLSMVEEIVSLNCPADCSGHGACVNGTCECHFAYTNVDCSVRVGVAPFNITIPKSGLCDVSKKPCAATRVYGQPFVKSPKLSCRMRETQVDYTGMYPTGQMELTRAVFVNEFEIICILPTAAPNGQSGASRPWITGYMVSVSNDGVKYGDETPILPRDPTCLNCSVEAGQFTCVLEGSYCLINEACYTEGQKGPSRSCYKCDPSLSKVEWTYEEEPGVTCGACDVIGSCLWVTLLVFGSFVGALQKVQY